MSEYWWKKEPETFYSSHILLLFRLNSVLRICGQTDILWTWFKVVHIWRSHSRLHQFLDEIIKEQFSQKGKSTDGGWITITGETYVSCHWSCMNRTCSLGKKMPPGLSLGNPSSLWIFSLFCFRYGIRFKATGCDRSIWTVIKEAKAGNGRNAGSKYRFSVQEVRWQDKKAWR